MNRILTESQDNEVFAYKRGLELSTQTVLLHNAFIVMSREGKFRTAKALQMLAHTAAEDAEKCLKRSMMNRYCELRYGIEGHPDNIAK